MGNIYTCSRLSGAPLPRSDLPDDMVADRANVPYILPNQSASTPSTQSQHGGDENRCNTMVLLCGIDSIIVQHAWMEDGR